MAAKANPTQTTPEPASAPAEIPVSTQEPNAVPVEPVSTPEITPTPEPAQVPEPTPAVATVKALRITAKVGGFRRGGIAHPAEPTVYRAGELTKAQVEQIAAEPMLVVEVIDVDA